MSQTKPESFFKRGFPSLYSGAPHEELVTIVNQSIHLVCESSWAEALLLFVLLLGWDVCLQSARFHCPLREDVNFLSFPTNPVLSSPPCLRSIFLPFFLSPASRWGIASMTRPLFFLPLRSVDGLRLLSFSLRSLEIQSTGVPATTSFPLLCAPSNIYSATNFFYFFLAIPFAR